MRDHGLEVEAEEEEFGYGKLMIDYKPPKQSKSTISNKGKRHATIKKLELKVDLMLTGHHLKCLFNSNELFNFS